MKVRPNAPCPCGSGLKYKKCCMVQSTSSSPASSGSSVTQAQWVEHWLPLEEHQRREAYLSLEAFAHRLIPEQLQYLGQISTLCEANAKESAQRGLALFDKISSKDQPFLYALMLKPTLLRQLGLFQEAYQVCFEQLCRAKHESMWIEFGGIIWEWLQQTDDPSTIETIIAGLRHVVTTDSFVPPRLLLAQLFSHQPSEILTLSLKKEHKQLQVEALQYSSWQPYSKNGIGPWLPIIAQQLFALIEDLQQTDRSQALTYGRSILSYPWEHYLQSHEQDFFERLCLVLLHLELNKELKLLCERMSRKAPMWGRIWFWLGYLSYQVGKTKQSLEHFQKAVQVGQIERHHRLNMLPILIFEGKFEESRMLLDAFEDRNAPDYLQMEIEYCNQTNQARTGLRHCEQLLLQMPDYAPARFHQAVWLDELGHPEEAEATLLPLVTDELSEQSAYACLLLIGININRDEMTKASLFLDKLLPKERAFSFFQDHSWRRTFIIHHGVILERRQKYDEALEWFQEALSYPPQEPIYGYMLELLWEQKRYEEARILGKKALLSCPNAPQLKCALCQMEDFFGHWKESLQFHEDLGFEWFKEENKLVDGIALKARSLLGLGQPLKALQFCEGSLEDILKDPTLKALREQILKEVQAQFNQMQSQLGHKDEQYQQLEETQRMLTKQRQENQRRERAYRQILQKHEVLRRSITKPEVPRFVSPQSQQKDLFEENITLEIVKSLPSTLLPILESALHLWEKLASHPEQDHGPVILQLARVVEGQINLLLVDPICDWVLREGYSLSDLPRPSIGSLKSDHNRLSLGDAASVLYHRLKKIEADGTISISKNPRSTDKHAKIVEQFWSQDAHQDLFNTPKGYCQTDLISDLQQLARARNHAGHANTPLTREQARKVRALVLGNSEKKGILWYLAEKKKKTREMEIKLPQEESKK